MNDIEQIAKNMYNYYISNDPLIHCNRFLSWEELSEQEKLPWIRRAERDT